MNDRPMPGPPEIYDIDWDPVWGVVWVDLLDGREQTVNHYELDKKRMTDAECTSEYWRADADYQTERLAELSMRLSNLQRTILDDLPAAPHTVSKTRTQARRQWKTWHRFATRPHVLEDTNG